MLVACSETRSGPAPFGARCWDEPSPQRTLDGAGPTYNLLGERGGAGARLPPPVSVGFYRQPRSRWLHGQAGGMSSRVDW